MDLAAYFGLGIDELEFFGRLPVSDNPEVGFVGDVNGRWGQIPPNAYGIHAEPVAALGKQTRSVECRSVAGEDQVHPVEGLDGLGHPTRGERENPAAAGHAFQRPLARGRSREQDDAPGRAHVGLF